MHDHVLAPVVLLDLLEQASPLDLLDFKVVDFYDTSREALEFFVFLERTPRKQRPGEKLETQLAGLAWACGRLSKLRSA